MSKSVESLWNKVLENLKQSDEIKKQDYTIWLKDTKALNQKSDTLTIIVPDDIARNHFRDSKIGISISRAIEKVNGSPLRCNYITEEEVSKEPAASESPYQQRVVSSTNEESNASFNTMPRTEFNPNYTFSSYIIGPNNELAYAAAESIAKNPAGQYNPLFIYGESGLGKTHILQAIGNSVMQQRPELRVLYVTSEQFISEFIHSIMTKTQQSLKIKYRNVDVLLIDDIQFLANKDETQNEFFHTFNELHVNKKQIVLTSDKPPRDLSKLTDRLRTRFEWGLITDIKAPSLETREAILRKKAQAIGLIVEDEIITYLAKRIKSNIRLLESALNKLHAIALIKKSEITLELVKQHLKPHFEEQKNKELTVDEILLKVAEKYAVNVDNIKSKSRHSSIIQPRFISMYLSTQLTNLTTTQIGTEIGGRDHSTVINARNNIQKQIKEDENLKEMLEDIIAELKS